MACLWGTNLLKQLEKKSIVQKKLYTDKVIARMERISYARVLIEIDVSNVLPESIELIVQSGVFQQRVTYEWKPKFYNEFLKHGDANCWKNVQEQPIEGQKQEGIPR